MKPNDMEITWGEAFINPSSITGADPKDLVSQAVGAWANCIAGLGKPPENFGLTLVAIGKKIGMSETPTCDNLLAFAERKGWIKPKRRKNGAK